MALSHVLKPIVADGRSGVEAFLEITGLNEIPIALGMVPPTRLQNNRPAECFLLRAPRRARTPRRTL